jgi:hypothetical protein
MRILVCGGREPHDPKWVYNKLYDIIPPLFENWAQSNLTIIHGCARGVDSIASEWAADQFISQDAYPAQWEKYGKRAGYIRNKQMLEEGKPDLVIAFPGGKGTAMMVDIARKAGVEVLEVTYEC